MNFQLLSKNCGRLCQRGVLSNQNVRFLGNYQRFTRHRGSWITFNAGILGALLGTTYFIKRKFEVAHCEAPLKEKKKPKYYKTIRQDLPTYRREEIRRHTTIANRIWLTYGIGVYDITDFIPKHPGASNILLGAGEAIEPFWNIYQQHNTVEVLRTLELYRIGNLHPDDAVDTSDLYDPWQHEPERDKRLIVVAQRPFNAEPHPKELIEKFHTENNKFYIRNHLPVPEIDIKTYEIEFVNEKNGKTMTLNFDELSKKYKSSEITATIMCGGNRRSEMMDVKPVKGLRWGQTAVGNAKWKGFRLAEILQDLGVESNETDHVHFEGLDTDPTYTPYAASVPLYRAMDPRADILLAYEMNGKPLSKDHGYPIRVVVPGVVGARNVKWLGKIIISPKESNSHWQQKDYKGFSPSTDWDNAEWEKSPAIQNMPVTSAICTPANGDKVKVNKNGRIELKGYAWSGGGNRIVRVDITSDEGKTWHVAELEQEDNEVAPSGRHWGWTLWKIELPVPKNSKEVTIWAKAVDSNYNVQPESFENIFNFRGVLSNAYHKIKVNLI
uniref:sulfite oxidase n=1 Tax=Culicoides sonorensis TaxID=179676 RepID=A0A336LNS1_CULSO